jgi:hypothetical protein
MFYLISGKTTDERPFTTEERLLMAVLLHEIQNNGKAPNELFWGLQSRFSEESSIRAGMSCLGKEAVLYSTKNALHLEDPRLKTEEVMKSSIS